MSKNDHPSLNTQLRWSFQSNIFEISLILPNFRPKDTKKSPNQSSKVLGVREVMKHLLQQEDSIILMISQFLHRLLKIIIIV